jgi:hypothetical protein
MLYVHCSLGWVDFFTLYIFNCLPMKVRETTKIILDYVTPSSFLVMISWSFTTKEKNFHNLGSMAIKRSRINVNIKSTRTVQIQRSPSKIQKLQKFLYNYIFRFNLLLWHMHLLSFISTKNSA